MGKKTAPPKARPAGLTLREVTVLRLAFFARIAEIRAKGRSVPPGDYGPYFEMIREVRALFEKLTGGHPLNDEEAR